MPRRKLVALAPGSEENHGRSELTIRGYFTTQHKKPQSSDRIPRLEVLINGRSLHKNLPSGNLTQQVGDNWTG